MDMDAAGVVCKTASFTQATYNVLQGSNIFVISKDRTDELARIQRAAWDVRTVNAVTTGDAAIEHDFPGSPVWSFDDVSVVIIPGESNLSSEII